MLMTFDRPRREHYSLLGTDDATLDFPGPDVSFALEWASVAPGIGGWDVRVDDETHPRLVSVVPPGALDPTFIIFRRENSVSVIWIVPNITGKLKEIARFANLPDAVLALCPLDDRLLQEVTKAMEVLYPPALRK